MPLQVPLTYEHEDESSHHHDHSLNQVCVNHSSQTPCQENQRQPSVCHCAQANRFLNWKKAFFSPSPVISGQTHWEKLALSCSTGAHRCHKPSHEEQRGRFSVFMRELGGSSASYQLKLLILQKGNKIENMGSCNFLHRGSQEPCAVLENPPKTVMFPLYHFPWAKREEGKSQRLPTSGRDKTGTTNNWSNLSLRPGPEYSFPSVENGKCIP